MAKWCKRAVALMRAWLDTIRLNNRAAFEQSGFVRSVFDKHMQFIDVNKDSLVEIARSYREVIDIAQRFGYKEYTNQVTRVFNSVGKLGKLETKQLLEWGYPAFKFRFLKRPTTAEEIALWKGNGHFGLLDAMSKSLPTEMEHLTDYIPYWQPEWIALTNEDLIGHIIYDTIKIYYDNGYDLNALIKWLNHGDIIQELHSVTNWDVKITLAEALADRFTANQLKPENIHSTAVQFFKEKFIDEWLVFSNSNTEALARDLLWQWLFTGKMKVLSRIMLEARAAMNIIQLALPTHNWLTLMYQSFIVGLPHYFARKASATGMDSHPVIDTLLKDFKFLVNESAEDTDYRIFEDMWQTYVMRWWYWLVDFILKAPWLSEKWKDSLRWKGRSLWSGMQNVYDMYMENYAKRVTIAQALNQMGIVTKEQADAFLKDIQAWKVNEEYIARIRWESYIKYAGFRANSDIIALWRNRFSKVLFMNLRAGYLINRAADITNALDNTMKRIADWEIKSLWDFIRHINADEDMRTIVLNMIIAGKLALYMDRVYDDDTEANKVSEYWIGLNDYYQALTTNLPARLLLTPFTDTNTYMEYMEKNGETVTVANMWNAFAYNTMNNLFRQMFRELQVIDLAGSSAKNIIGVMSWHTSFEDAWDSTIKAFDKLASSSWRFALDENIAPYGLLPMRRYDDTITNIMMIGQETNDSKKAYANLRTVEWIEKYMQNKTVTVFNMLRNINGLKWLNDTLGMNELAVDRIYEMVNNDKVMNDLYNGKWNGNVVTKDNTKRLFNELTSMDLAAGKQLVNWLFKPSEYDFNTDKKDVFEKELIRAIGSENINKLKDKILDYTLDWKIREWAIAEMLAYSDAKVPWSSRLMLSHIANQLKTSYVQRYYAEAGMKNAKFVYSDDAIPADELLRIQSGVVNALYPYMYTADKLSWYKLAEERMLTVNPKLFSTQTLSTNPNEAKQPAQKLARFANAVGFLDFMAHSELKEGNPNATGIKNVFAFMGKYVEDDALKASLFNMTLDTVDALEWHPDVKNAVKLWVALGWFDSISNLLSDTDAYAKHGKVLDEAVKKLFWVNNTIATIGTELAIGELKGSQAKSYGNYTGYKYTPKQYAKSNYTAKQQLADSVNELWKRVPSQYSWNTYTKEYNPTARYISFTPQYWSYRNPDSKFYLDVFAKVLWEAESKNLVNWYVKHSATDVDESQGKFSKTFKPKAIKARKVKVPKNYLNYQNRHRGWGEE